MEQKKPFRIRAHHLFRNRNLFAAAIVASPKKDTRVNAVISHQTVFLLDWATSPHEELQVLGQDYLGTKPHETFRAYQRKIKNYFADFMQLQESDPVTLSTLRDGLCEACVIGRHCQEDQDDQAFLEKFLAVVKTTRKIDGKEYGVTMQEDRPTRIDTTKGTVITVLQAYEEAFLDTVSILIFDPK
jgi:hypothetical protein